jgi:hypothetical protein
MPPGSESKGLMVGDWKFFSCCIYAAGYPAQPPFPINGTHLYWAYGTYANFDQAYTIGMNGNNMTPDTSGAPWFSVAIYPARPPTAYPQIAWIVGLNAYDLGSSPPVYSPLLRFGVADLWFCVNNPC